MLRKILIAAALAVGATCASADVLLIDRVELSVQTVPDRPARGTTMERVEATYGAPSGRRAAVGEPPITRWEYPEFIVYFEHRLVLHAVARR
jgi:hypothetical protein